MRFRRSKHSPKSELDVTMPLPRSILFIDGENLCIRYQEMHREGRLPRNDVVHHKDTFVWRSQITGAETFRLEKVVRVCYYTSVVGDDDKVVQVKQRLSQLQYDSRGDDGGIVGRVVPVVFKKVSKSQKVKNVDIQIVIDVMRFAFTDEIERVYLASGDGDYLPLIHEVMRRGKQVEILAFSSGLSEALRYTADNFYLLDDVFFEPTNTLASSGCDAASRPDDYRTAAPPPRVCAARLPSGSPHVGQIREDHDSVIARPP